MLMKTVTRDDCGGPDVPRLVTVRWPDPGPTSVLIPVAVAGVCHHDLVSRAGLVRGARNDQTPGHEVAGEIAAAGLALLAECIGQGVAVYQRIVCGTCRCGLGGRHDLCRIPESIGFAAAVLAAFHIGTGIRAALGMTRIGPVIVVLITGAGGGLGLHQIQIAKSVSAGVVAVTKSQAKEAAIREAGADKVITSRDRRFCGEVWRLTDKQGVDVALKNVATGCLGESLRSYGRDAVVAVLGNISAGAGEIDPGTVISRRIRMTGSGNATFADMRLALDLIDRGIIGPMIGHMQTFSEAALGLALMERRAVAGRVVLIGW
jgi:acryloyl-coenzyme A reductase